MPYQFFMPSEAPVRLWCLAIGMLIVLSALRKGASTGQDVSTCPRRSTSRNRWSSGRTTSAPAARAAAAMPLRAKQDRGSLMLTSVTMARRAPASRQSRPTSATTSGLVLAAWHTLRYLQLASERHLGTLSFETAQTRFVTL